MFDSAMRSLGNRCLTQVGPPHDTSAIGPHAEKIWTFSASAAKWHKVCFSAFGLKSRPLGSRRGNLEGQAMRREFWTLAVGASLAALFVASPQSSLAQQTSDKSAQA